MTEHDFIRLASFSTHCTNNYDTKAAKKQFRETFGVSTYICSIIWAMIAFNQCPESEINIQPVHLLWTLLFLRQYMTSIMMEAHIKNAQDYFQVCMGLGGHPCRHGPKYCKSHVVVVVVIFCSSLLLLMACLFQSTHPFFGCFCILFYTD